MVCPKFSWVRPKFVRSPKLPSAGPLSRLHPPRRTAQNFALFFPSPATSLILSSAALGPPGLHTTARELQTCTFEGRGFQSHHQFHETTPKRGRKNENSGGSGKKKNAKFWASHPAGPVFASCCCCLMLAFLVVCCFSCCSCCFCCRFCGFLLFMVLLLLLLLPVILLLSLLLCCCCCCCGFRSPTVEKPILARF